MTPEAMGTRVLLADDDADDYMIFSLAIEELAVTIALTRVDDGEKLIKVLSENIPDILFLDIDMPCKDGRQCLKEIRANRRYDDLPIIMYSSFSDLTTIEYCFRERSNLYAHKPNTVGELTGILSRILTVDWKKTMHYPTQSEFVIKPL